MEEIRFRRLPELIDFLEGYARVDPQDMKLRTYYHEYSSSEIRKYWDDDMGHNAQNVMIVIDFVDCEQDESTFSISDINRMLKLSFALSDCTFISNLRVENAPVWIVPMLLQALDRKPLLSRTPNLLQELKCLDINNFVLRGAANTPEYCRMLSLLKVHAHALSDTTSMMEVMAFQNNAELGMLNLDGRRSTDATGLALASALQEHHGIRTISFNCGGCTDKTGLALANVLQKHPRVLSFKICGRHYTDVTGLALAQALEQNEVLQALEVSDNEFHFDNSFHQEWHETSAALNSCKISSSLFTDLTGSALLRGLRKHIFQLQQVSIDVKKLTDNTGIALAELISGSTIKCFVLGSGKYTDRTGLALTKAFQKSPCLQSIVICSCKFTDSTGLALVEVLQTSAVLRNLKIIRTRFSDETGVALAVAMKDASSLMSLELIGCKCTDLTGLAMAEALQQNSVLQTFEMRCDHDVCTVSARSAVRFAQCLKHHVSLKSFKLTSYGQIDDDSCWDTCVALTEVFRNNSTLEYLEWHGYTCIDQDIQFSLSLDLDAAFNDNCVLLGCNIDINDGWGMSIKLGNSRQVVHRNREARMLWSSLSVLSKFHHVTKSSAVWANNNFRTRFFSFFLPASCAVLPKLSHLPLHMLTSNCFRDTQIELCDTSASVLVELDPHLGRGESMAMPCESSEKDLSLDEALQASILEATEKENADIAEAVVRSRVDVPARLGGDGVVLLRLARHARSPDVAKALSGAPVLATCRHLVEESGCEIRPAWADGAWILMPFTREQCDEIGCKLSSVHILMLSQDEALVREALKSVPRAKRPHLRVEVLQDANFGVNEAENENPRPFVESSHVKSSEDDNSADVSLDPHDQSKWLVDYDIVAERTFITLRSVNENSVASQVSAPARLETHYEF